MRLYATLNDSDSCYNFQQFNNKIDYLDTSDLLYSTTSIFSSLVGFLTSSSTTRLYRGRVPRLNTHETERGDHDFCLSRLHYTDTDPTSRERAATVGIEPGTSSSGVVRSTD